MVREQASLIPSHAKMVDEKTTGGGWLLGRIEVTIEWFEYFRNVAV
jgi:hypothetical protein